MNTRLLLALAALLITNSHLERFYPSPLFAGDGHLGNSVFFMVAGLGIALSAKKKLRSFPDYYWRRIKRIYPTVFLIVTACIFIPQQGWTAWSWQQYFSAYIWPTPWAFIEYVMIFYVGFYALLKVQSAQIVLWLFWLGILPFTICWYLHPQAEAKLTLGSLHESIWWIFWAQMMLLGGYLGMKGVKGDTSLVRDAIMFGVTFCIYVVLKVLFVTGRVAQGHFLLFAVDAFLVYVIARLSAAPLINGFLSAHAWAGKPVEWIGARTLEIYVLQGFLVYRDDLARAFRFPLNLVCLVVVLSFGALIAHFIVATLIPERRARPGIA